MKINELAVATSKASKRVGRGISAGGGKTAGRGTKGQKARTGKKIKLGFEGGQTKLSARIPKKRGFTAVNRVSYVAISTDQLELVSTSTVTAESLVKAKLIKNANLPIKLLAGTKKLEKAYTVQLHGSAKAKKMVEAAGGSVASQSSKEK